MNKKMIFFIILFMTVACSKDYSYKKDSVEEASVLNDSYEQKQRYNLLIESDQRVLTKYEPIDGAYIGAYILSNPVYDFDIDKFESITQKKHAMYAYYLKIGDSFPESWILECISNNKTPNIVLMPQNEYNPFDENLLIRTAKDLGKYNIPIFVNLLPNPSTKKYNSTAYKEFFKKAKESFDLFASNTSFIFSIKPEEFQTYKEYYPGDEYVDWIGLNTLIKAKNLNISEPNPEEIYESNIFNEIDYFYYTFQKQKPLMISELGISNYNKNNGSYYIEEAKTTLENLYNKIRLYYPNIKSIVYMDFNNILINPNGSDKNSYSITENKNLLSAYRKVVKEPYFLETIKVTDKEKEVSNVFIKSPFDVIKINNSYFISENSILYDLNIKKTNFDYNFIRKIAGEKYIDSNALEAEGIRKVIIDDNLKKVTLLK